MAGNRVYVSAFDNITIGTTVQDIFSIVCTAAVGVELHYIELNAGAVTAAAEIRLRLKRFTGATRTAGSVGTAPATNTLDSTDAAAVAVVRANDTTQSTTTGTTVNLMYWQWNVLLPFQYMPAPEDRPIIAAGVNNAFILDMPAASGASIVGSGILKWRELP